MKKIAFGFQVFTLITLFPLYVIIELNQAKVAPFENKTVTEVRGNAMMNSEETHPSITTE